MRYTDPRRLSWDTSDRVKEMITETIPFRVFPDAAFKNARENSDQENARIEHGKALTRVMTALIKDDAELFKPIHGQRQLQALDDRDGVRLGL